VPVSRLRLASTEVYRERPPRLQSTCSCPSTSPLRLIRSNVSLGDLQRAPARCSIRPVRRSRLQVAACSRGDASHGLFVTSTTVPLGASHPARGTRSPEYKTACRAPVRTCTELYGSATSVWVQASPQSELMGPSSAGIALAPGILLRTAFPDRCRYSSRCSSSARVRWKLTPWLTLTGEVESLAARY